MIKSIYNNIIMVGLLIMTLSSCVTHQELVNFQQNPPALNAPVDIANLQEARIQSDDILRITVHSFSELAAQPFNMAEVQQQGTNSNNINLLQLSGYLVDSLGYINFPVVGEVKVGGLSLRAATDTLESRVRPLLSDAVVNVRYLNFRYTVMGEVNVPGTYNTMNKRLTVLEAIGTAGDLTLYSNRTNVLLIREVDGKREFARLNLQSSEIFTSPYFFIRQNDIIYVEPIKARVATVQDPVNRYIGFASGGLSLIAIIISLLRKP